MTRPEGVSPCIIAAHIIFAIPHGLSPSAPLIACAFDLEFDALNSSGSLGLDVWAKAGPIVETDSWVNESPLFQSGLAQADASYDDGNPEADNRLAQIIVTGGLDTTTCTFRRQDSGCRMALRFVQKGRLFSNCHQIGP